MRCGDKSGEEKERRYRAIKKSSLRAQNTKRTVCKKKLRVRILASKLDIDLESYLVGVVEVENPALALIDTLMA